MQIDLEVTPTGIDLSLSCKFENDQIIRINGSHVHDLLRAVNNDRMTQADADLERFETAGNDQPPCIFAGKHITKNIMSSTKSSISI